MKSAFDGLILAMQFLTRIPVATIPIPWEQRNIRWALRFYPLAGIVIGAVVGGAFLFSNILLPDWLTALITLSVWIMVTGGLHLDGWSDVFDAIGSNAPMEKKWQIMKDPHVGGFGVLSLFLLILWKLGFLFGLAVVARELEWGTIMGFFMLVPGIARFNALFLMYHLPVAKKQGLGWEWKKHLAGGDVVIASLPLALFAFFIPGSLSIIGLSILFVTITDFWIRKSFNAFNGDLIGASIEGGELWGIIVVWSYLSFVMG